VQNQTSSEEDYTWVDYYSWIDSWDWASCGVVPKKCLPCQQAQQQEIIVPAAQEQTSETQVIVPAAPVVTPAAPAEQPSGESTAIV